MNGNNSGMGAFWYFMTLVTLPIAMAELLFNGAVLIWEYALVPAFWFTVEFTVGAFWFTVSALLWTVSVCLAWHYLALVSLVLRTAKAWVSFSLNWRHVLRRTWKTNLAKLASLSILIVAFQPLFQPASQIVHSLNSGNGFDGAWSNFILIMQMAAKPFHMAWQANAAFVAFLESLIPAIGGRIESILEFLFQTIPSFFRHGEEGFSATCAVPERNWLSLACILNAIQYAAFWAAIFIFMPPTILSYFFSRLEEELQAA